MTAEDPRLVAAEVARREFAHGFRGYQVDEVRAFLDEFLPDDWERLSEGGPGSDVQADFFGGGLDAFPHIAPRGEDC